MKAIAIKEAGPANTLKIVELPIPDPQENEVVIKQSHAGVNYGDVIRRKRGLFEVNETGYYVPGFEGVGIIASVGKNVTDLQVGDRVAYLNSQNGGYGQFVSVAQEAVYRVPQSIQDETAAGMTCVGLTAWHLLRLSGASNNDFVIVHGATGGVGLVLTQLCLLKGIKVIAIVGTQDKKEFLNRYNPTETIVRNEVDVADKVKSLTDGQGVTAIFDCVGEAVLDINMNSIKKGGTILYYGSTSGHSSFPGLQILMNSLRVQGFNIFNLIQNKGEWQKGLQEFTNLLAQNNIEIFINETFKLAEAYKAHELLENRQSTGKLILDLRE
ncbi:MAG: zinc-binding dehydrogenase [Chlorobiales bacterium]|nr:zinc-binding dehydrogenase [Chlorobiales bacterium]